MKNFKCPYGKCTKGKFICCLQCKEKLCKGECCLSGDECKDFNAYRMNADNYKRTNE